MQFKLLMKYKYYCKWILEEYIILKMAYLNKEFEFKVKG